MPSKVKIPIEGLLESYETALARTGYSITTKLLLVKRAELMIRRHLNVGLEYFDQAVVNLYTSEIDDKYFKGNMQKKHYERTKREIDRFVSYVNTGEISSLPSTYKYFAWLEEQGFFDIAGAGAIYIQKFLLSCSEKYAPSTIHDVRLYLRKLYAFLYATERAEDNYSALFSFSVNREKKVFPVLPKSDIAKLLDAIDRSTVRGKRDYAIMMLGTVLGLRACDIVALKLTDIDWLRGEIRITQSKTANPVSLPLTQDVGEALKDYILNARPSTADHEIFLRINAPHTKLASAVTVGEVYRDCCVAAGLPANKRFHNLRRALGTSMVTNGVSVYDVAQVFGDKNINSTKPYLATDVEHLKMCALSFEGIAPAGGDPQ